MQLTGLQQRENSSSWLRNFDESKSTEETVRFREQATILNIFRVHWDICEGLLLGLYAIHIEQ